MGKLPNREEYDKQKKEAAAAFREHDRQQSFRIVLQHRCGKGVKEDGPFVCYIYKELRDRLNVLTEEQLSQQVQIIPKSVGGPISLEPVIAAGTVEEMFHVEGKMLTETHSSVDWKHHPEEFVLLTDGNGFGEHGDTAYKMEDRDGELVFVGNKSGIAKPLVKRRPGEPSQKTSRTKPFHEALFPGLKIEELTAKLDEECDKIEQGISTDRQNITLLMAELYRRTYKLESKEQQDERRKKSIEKYGEDVFWDSEEDD